MARGWTRLASEAALASRPQTLARKSPIEQNGELAGSKDAGRHQSSELLQSQWKEEGWS